MRKVFLSGVYIEEDQAFIAKQKTKRTFRESREINALTGPDLIKGRTGMIEIRRGEVGMKDQKRSMLRRSKKRRDRKARRIRQIPITVVRIRTEVVKALQTRSPPHALESPTVLTGARVCHDSPIHPNLHH